MADMLNSTLSSLYAFTSSRPPNCTSSDNDNVTVADEEPDIYAEPEVTAEPEPLAEAEPMESAEGWTWIPYQLTFGTLFAVVLVWALVNLVNLWRKTNIASIGYHITLNMMMMLVGACRIMDFTFSHYSSCSIPIVAVWLITHQPVPCLTTAFFLVFSALKSMTQMKLVAGQLFKPWFLVVLVISNFSISISADLLTLYVIPSGVGMKVCRAYFILLGAVGFAAFVWDYYNLYQATVVNRRWIHDHGDTKSTSKPQGENHTKGSTDSLPDDTQNVNSSRDKLTSKKQNATKIPVGVRVTLVAACLLLGLSIWNGLDLVLGEVYIDGQRVSSQEGFSWPFKVSMRLLESTLAGTVLFVTSLPLYRN